MPALHVLRIDLRQVGVDAQRLDGLQVEEFLARARVDQLAGVDVARGDHAVERRIDLLEGLQFAQPLHIGLRGSDRRRGGRGLVDECVGVLARNGVRFDQPGVAVGLDARVVGVGLGGVQVGSGPGPVAGPLRAWRSRPAARPFLLSRRCRSTSGSGSRRCARRWANP